MFPLVGAIFGLIIGAFASPNPIVAIISGAFLGVVAWALTGYKLGSGQHPNPMPLLPPPDISIGMSARDKWHLEQTEVMLAPLAIIMEEEVKPLARQIFDEAKAEASKKYGTISTRNRLETNWLQMNLF